MTRYDTLWFVVGEKFHNLKYLHFQLIMKMLIQLWHALSHSPTDYCQQHAQIPAKTPYCGVTGCQKPQLGQLPHVHLPRDSVYHCHSLPKRQGRGKSSCMWQNKISFHPLFWVCTACIQSTLSWLYLRAELVARRIRLSSFFCLLDVHKPHP